MHITQQMTSINIDFQVAAAVLGKKKVYLQGLKYTKL